ncbi:MAG: hypothetical protein IPH09_07790 [bacterium]|nr:hypothetical protein [bacterium]
MSDTRARASRSDQAAATSSTAGGAARRGSGSSRNPRPHAGQISRSGRRGAWLAGTA